MLLRNLSSKNLTASNFSASKNCYILSEKFTSKTTGYHLVKSAGLATEQAADPNNNNNNLPITHFDYVPCNNKLDAILWQLPVFTKIIKPVVVQEIWMVNKGLKELTWKDNIIILWIPALATFQEIFIEEIKDNMSFRETLLPLESTNFDEHIQRLWREYNLWLEFISEPSKEPVNTKTFKSELTSFFMTIHNVNPYYKKNRENIKASLQQINPFICFHWTCFQLVIILNLSQETILLPNIQNNSFFSKIRKMKTKEEINII